MSTKAPAVSKSPSISRRLMPLSMTCVSPVLRGLTGRSGTPRNPSSKPGISGTIPNRSHSDRLSGLVHVAEQALNLVRARGLRVGEVPASPGRVGRESGQVSLRHTELSQPGRPRQRGERLNAAGRVAGIADPLAEALHGCRGVPGVEAKRGWQAEPVRRPAREPVAAVDCLRPPTSRLS